MQSTRLRKCKVGNWAEEVAFELDKKAMVSKAREQAQSQHSGGDAATATASAEGENNKKDSFFKYASTGATNIASLSAQIVAKREHHLQPAQLGASVAGYVPFGVPIMLQNAETEGMLSIDLHDRQGVGKYMKIATTTSSASTGAKPVLRNTWVLLPVPEDIELVRMRYNATRSVAPLTGAGRAADPDVTDPSRVLHYGQRFVVCSLEEMALPGCHGDAPECVFLASETRSASSQAKRSNCQETYFTPFSSQKTWWTAVHAHPDFRQDMEFTPVKAGSLMLLRHQLTATPLASTKTPCPNDFGAEFETCAHRHLRVRVKNGNALETDANFWCVVTGDDPTDSGEAAQQQDEE